MIFVSKCACCHSKLNESSMDCLLFNLTSTHWAQSTLEGSLQVLVARTCRGCKQSGRSALLGSPEDRHRTPGSFALCKLAIQKLLSACSNNDKHELASKGSRFERKMIVCPLKHVYQRVISELLIGTGSQFSMSNHKPATLSLTDRCHCFLEFFSGRKEGRLLSGSIATQPAGDLSASTWM